MLIYVNEEYTGDKNIIQRSLLALLNMLNRGERPKEVWDYELGVKICDVIYRNKQFVPTQVQLGVETIKILPYSDNFGHGIFFEGVETATTTTTPPPNEFTPFVIKDTVTSIHCNNLASAEALLFAVKGMVSRFKN